MTIYGYVMANSDPEIPSDAKTCIVEIFTSESARNDEAYKDYSELYDELKSLGEIDKDFTPRKRRKNEFFKAIRNDIPVVIQCIDYHINFEFFEKNITTT